MMVILSFLLEFECATAQTLLDLLVGQRQGNHVLGHFLAPPEWKTTMTFAQYAALGIVSGGACKCQMG